MITVKEINNFNAEALKDRQKKMTDKANKLIESISDKAITAKLNMGKPEFVDAVVDMSSIITELNRLCGTMIAVSEIVDYYDESK